MNLLSFLPIVSRFNNVPHVNLMKESDIILIHFKEYTWQNKFITSLQHFDKIVSDRPNTTRPFIKALKKFLRTEALVTVFLLKNDIGYLEQNILIGSNKLLVPVENEKDGTIHLVILPLFCKNIKKQMKKYYGCAEDTHFLDNHVLFLDAYQIPYPGGSYYDTDNVDIGDTKRMCLITRDLENVSENIFTELYKITMCSRYYLHTKTCQLKLPDLFFVQSPVEGVNFQEANLRHTELIDKTYSKQYPEFLLQDILNTYARKMSDSNHFPLANVALFIEYPISLDYKDIHGSDTKQCSLTNETRYYLFFVNSLNPKKILQVKQPYDRYYEYENMEIEKRHSENATMFYYMPNHKARVPYSLERVIIGNVMLGYRYKNYFLCLGYPLLLDAPRINEIYENEGNKIQNSHNYNTDCLLNAFRNYDFASDSLIKVYGKYNFDDKYDIYKINHVGCRNDTWCLVAKTVSENVATCSQNSSLVTGEKRKSSYQAAEEPTPKYYRRALAPITTFVAAWVEFFMQNIDLKSKKYDNLNVFKLAMVLARHKICFKMRVKETREIGLLGRNEYVFYLDQPAINFVNSMRLLTTTEPDDNEEEEYNCTIT